MPSIATVKRDVYYLHHGDRGAAWIQAQYCCLQTPSKEEPK